MSEQRSQNDVFLAEIRAELGRQKISQRQLGRMLGWPTTTTYYRLNGRMALSAERLLTIATVLDVPVTSLGFQNAVASDQGVRS